MVGRRGENIRVVCDKDAELKADFGRARSDAKSILGGPEPTNPQLLRNLLVVWNAAVKSGLARQALLSAKKVPTDYF
jgi:hypothetical protein